jgi:ribosomal 50S subunit-recycling heat shock protein
VRHLIAIDGVEGVLEINRQHAKLSVTPTSDVLLVTRQASQDLDVQLQHMKRALRPATDAKTILNGWKQSASVRANDEVCDIV